MIKLLSKLPWSFTLAVSGGPDSMAALDFFHRGKKDFRVVHVNHGTAHASEAEELVRSECERLQVNLRVEKIVRQRDLEESWEEFWRNERYRIFDTITGPVLTCHNLDDAVEWWVYTAMHGQPRLIPESNGSVLRPFLLTPKKTLRKWCKDHEVAFCDDPGNVDEQYMRSIVRHKIVPLGKRVNPGLEKVVKKMLIAKYGAEGK